MKLIKTTHDYIEDLNVSHMSTLAKGSQEQQGKNVKAKSALNKSILDQPWYEFRRQFEYKSDWHGGFVYDVDPIYISQTYHCCSHEAKDDRKLSLLFSCGKR